MMRSFHAFKERMAETSNKAMHDLPFFLFLGGFSILPSPIRALASEKSDAFSPAGGIGEASLKMIGSLLLIVGLILLLFYLIKRLRLNPLALRRDPQMRLIETLNLAPKRSVSLIEVRDHWLVLGVGAESVTLLSRLDAPPQPTNTHPGNPDDRRGFHSLLQNTIFRNRGRGE
jgi:flagellar protein FliO/FliZ